ncbi:hypothetical protein J2X20_003536 [Pelomonas saccharophila]|jgi:hypothetical protein|uniref:DUF2867 domain-containing protein n=1 Tax=Roseateles saccharophilus TaxID=304 RepID=A0ABU1YPT8_ROSSA|nr:hypothetical protein [Roseateles saccharophilus]MDR7270878.1 hypothetical protein [Roseateles saccharophilus]
MTPTDTPLPPASLLGQLAEQRGAFADAYTLRFPRAVTLAEFVEAFYTTRLFKAERALISLLGKPSSDAMARAVARGEGERLAVWTIEARKPDELLMHEDSGATRSWFKVEPGAAGATTLWFGSAVVPRRRGPGGEARMSWVFHALLGFHRWYSRALLSAAARRLG